MSTTSTAEQAPPRPRKRLPRLGWGRSIKVAVSLGLLALVFYLVDLNVLVNTLLSISPWFFLAGVALVHADRLLMAYKWRPLLTVLGVSVPLSTLFRIYVVTPIAQLVLPSTIGMDLFRVHGLARGQHNLAPVVASIVMERLIGLFAILALVAASFGLASYVLRDTWNYVGDMRWIVVAAAILGLVALAALLALLKLRRSAWAGRLAEGYVGGRLAKITSAFASYRNHPRTLVFVGIWTFIEQFFSIAITFLAVQALHVDVSWYALAIIVPIVVLAARLPISLDGIGIQEGLYVGLFGLAGVSVAEALLISAVVRAIILVSAMPWGVHYLFRGRGIPARAGT